MWRDYIATHPDDKCSYDFYRGIVSRDMNIRFTKLGSEQCETCLVYDNVKEQHLHEPSVCETCSSWRQHDKRQKVTRMEYKAEDCEANWPDDTIVRSVDLQKVIMLPRMPGVKSTAFTRGIIASI